MTKQRLLFAITVYNGRDVVMPCLRSAAAMVAELVDVDVIVLDDASPEPGFSDDVRTLTEELGLQYYRSPRNLGIPRNVNLALLRAMEADYDYVVIANSDVIFPSLLPDIFVEAAREDETIGSVTAWSNNVSIFSLPNTAPDLFLKDQEVVNWLSNSIRSHFGTATADIPAGISFCILIPVPVLRKVGLMDPVYGRGYCEESDWTLRSKSMGYRITLSPSAFTYHKGGGSNLDAGLVSDGHTSVPEHERIIDHRFPLFRSQVDAFINSELLDKLRRDAIEEILTDAARDWGYAVVAGSSQGTSTLKQPVVSLENRNGRLSAVVRFIGFEQVLPESDDLPAGIVAYFGAPPTSVHIIEPSGNYGDAAEWFGRAGSTVEREVCYPTKV